MKKQRLQSLRLKKNTISNFDSVEINGGLSGGACWKTKYCEGNTRVANNCDYSNHRTCTLPDG